MQDKTKIWDEQETKIQAHPETEFRNYLGRRVGDYDLVKLIGVGGVGIVFRARHRIVGREVAIKILKEENRVNLVLVERFLREAQAANDIHHENIVQVFDFKTDSEFGPYLVMELLEEGISLEGELLKNSLTEKRAVKIALQIAKVLDVAHSKQIVHRDLKPENVFLIQAHGQIDVVKILDFGIAKLMANTQPSLTETGLILGTLQYMSPEQCRGIQVDHRTDIYALGAILFEMITGRPVFIGEAFGDVMAQHLVDPPPNPRQFVPTLSSRIETVILRCLEKEKEKRYASAKEFAVALGADPDTFSLPASSKSFSKNRKGIFGKTPRVSKLLLWLAPSVFFLVGVILYGAFFSAPNTSAVANETPSQITSESLLEPEKDPEALERIPSFLPETNETPVLLEPLKPSSEASSLPASESLPSSMSLPTSLATSLPTSTSLPVEKKEEETPRKTTIKKKKKPKQFIIPLDEGSPRKKRK